MIVAVGLAARLTVGRKRQAVEYLVQRRPEGTTRGGLWEFPGGKVEPKESIREGLAREWLEELGVRVRVGRLLTEVEIEYPDLGRVLLPLFRVHPTALGGWDLQPQLGQVVAWRDLTNLQAMDHVPSFERYRPALTRFERDYMWDNA